MSEIKEENRSIAWLAMVLSGAELEDGDGGLEPRP
jgi:hypothetical protein